eukprot:m.178965 g.178965  ORF g.178965 m.178965 type:complete len:259 (+) comp17987_c2_seq6:119-895(+)
MEHLGTRRIQALAGGHWSHNDPAVTTTEGHSIEVVAGLAGSDKGAVSFKMPGKDQYLRFRASKVLKWTANDGSSRFGSSASFVLRTNVAASGYVAFEAISEPNAFIRDVDGHLKVFTVPNPASVSKELQTEISFAVVAAAGAREPVAAQGGVPCNRCKKTVYTAELVTTTQGDHFHRACFTCTKCRQHLTTVTYEHKDGEVYCRTCFAVASGVTLYGHGKLDYEQVLFFVCFCGGRLRVCRSLALNGFKLPPTCTRPV